MLGGTALAIYGWTRKSATGAALGLAGGAIALKAASAGPIADMLRSEISAKSTVLVNRTAADLYEAWKNFGRAPIWMEHIQSVTQIDETHWRWVRRDPAVGILEWTSELTVDIPNDMIGWRALPENGTDYDLTGRVEFKELESNRGTQVTLRLRYKINAGLLQGGAAMVLAEERELSEDLRRFKMLMETGEIATTQGQSHGPRGAKGKVLDKWLRGEAHASVEEKSGRSQRKIADDIAKPPLLNKAAG
jgi:uncharacterized membrane protein